MAFALRRRTRSATAQILGADFSHAAARGREGREGKKRDDAAASAMGRSRRAPLAVSRCTFQSGDLGIRLSQPCRLRRGIA
jgi:hypothetical protein